MANEPRLASLGTGDLGMTALAALVIDPRDGSVLLTMSGEASAGRGGVYRSRDEGVTWAWEGDGLADGAGFDYGINHSQGAWPRLVVSPDGSAVTAGRRDEGVLHFRAPDGGDWMKTNLTPPDWRMYPLAADPFVPGRFLCSGGGKPMMESTDGGRTWHAYGPLGDSECRGIAFDRQNPGLVAFGCRDGIYISADGGATTQLIDGGLEVPSGRSRTIALDRGRLFLLTSGSGVWRMDRTAEVRPCR